MTVVRITSSTASTIRSFTWRDLPALIGVMNRALAVDGEWDFVTEQDVRSYFSAPDRFPELDCLIAESADGELVGFCYVLFAETGAQAWLNGDVDPFYRAQGVGTRLLRASEHRVQQGALGRALASSMNLYVSARSTAGHKAQLLHCQGYRRVRNALLMRGDLAGLLTAPRVPGIRLRAFDPERDSYAVYAVEQASFAQHFGFVPVPYVGWRHDRFNDPRYDPNLWTVAEDPTTGAVIGFAVARAAGAAYPCTGWIDALGVLDAYRRRGIGAALLRRTAELFRARGWLHVELGVDAGNTTGAVQLYARLGMHVVRRDDVYHKMIPVPH